MSTDNHITAPSPTSTRPLGSLRNKSSPLASTLHYFTDPFSYTVSSVVRRLSEDEAPTPLARALSANYNGSMHDPSLGVYQPPPPLPTRRLSPFQPPPLTPLTLRGYRETTIGKGRLLSRALAEEIRLLLPPRLQLCSHWDLAYSLEQNGSTLSTLYSLCSAHKGRRGGYILTVRDSQGGVFGAYLSDAPSPSPHYYGNGECFLWRAQTLPALPDLLDLPPPPSEDTTHAQRMTTVALSRQPSFSNVNNNNSDPNSSSRRDGATTPERIRFKAFPYTGENDFCILCQPDYLSVGGGDGHYGLWLDDTLSNGVSQACLTYGNEGLSDSGKKFGVLGVEVWFVGGP